MFTYHDETTAPEASLPIMERSRKGFGTLPNLHRLLAEAPDVYETYLVAFDAVVKGSGFSSLEAQIVFMVANYENRCHYCTAGHSMVLQAIKAPAEIVEALREGAPIADPKLQELRAFTHDMLVSRGHLPPERLQQFLDAGYTRKQALGVICGLAAKVISNYTNALAQTELDPIIAPFAWTHPEDRT